MILGDSGGLENKVGYELLNSGLDKYVEDKSELSKFRSNRIKEIKTLEKLTNLEILNLDSNKITEIKGLQTLKNLRRLFLRNNRIAEIKGLEKLNNLEVLDLSYNWIKVVEGLENKKNLVQLNLAFNEIDDIGYIGDDVPKLKELKLYGNPGYWRINRPMGGEDFTGVLWKRP
ncbi:MAG: leucine-rich repeat domain-containing protein [Candidatus Lokiarchaeia archaeon]